MKNKKIFQKIMLSLLFFGLFIWISHILYFRIDLTSDKRYTLSQNTKNVLKKVKEPIIIDVLLSGEIPLEYKKLQRETLSLLQTYKAENKNIIFKFSDPLKDVKNTEQTLSQLMEFGLTPMIVNTQNQSVSSQSYMVPWAIANKGEKSEKIALIKNKLGSTDIEKIQNSVQQLEFAFTDAISKLVNEKTKKIAVLKSNGTLADIEMADFLSNIGQYYKIAPFTLDSVETSKEFSQKTLSQLNDFQLLMVAKPTEVFSENQKQIIDQFVMNGGAILWLMDSVDASLNQIRENQGVGIAMPLDLKLSDLFFKYGFRLNYDLINDLYFSQIVVAQGVGSQTQYTPIPWVYNPLILTKNNHLINKNLDAVRLQFANSIDTLNNGISKKILLHSSPISKTEGTPREIALSLSKNDVKKESYTQGNFPVSVLLEGKFTSVYKNRVKPFDLKDIKDEGENAKMIVVSDGDIIRNEISQGSPLELGYDPWTNNFYDNKSFLQNCVNYLLNDTSLLELRNKKVSISILNKEKLQKDKKFWQILNIFLPIVLIICTGFLFNYFYIRNFKR